MQFPKMYNSYFEDNIYFIKYYYNYSYIANLFIIKI